MSILSMISFSFIIPHRNSPELLNRCVDSIPERDDIEIIVVDDNSDTDKKPVIDRKNLTVVNLDAAQSKGAGHARNVGIGYAKGKWLLFADADDKYTEHLMTTLDSINHSEENVVYFNYRFIKGDYIDLHSLEGIASSHSEDAVFKVKYGTTVPWNKVVRHSFIKEFDIWFEECPVGNDILFSYQVAYFVGNNYRIVDVPLYDYYIVADSITHKKKHNESYYLTICKHIYQLNAFYVFIGRAKQAKSMYSKLAAILVKKGWSQFVLTLKVFLTNKEEIIRDRNYYVEIIKERENK